MAKTLERDVDKEIHVADIVRHGDKITIPEKMPIDKVIVLLKARMEYEEAEVGINETFSAFPWDGANALDRVLIDMFGWSPQVRETWREPPQVITIDVGFNKQKQVPWGTFKLPNIDGYVQCGTDMVDGSIRFKLTATVKRKDEATIRELFKTVREFLTNNSIYQGQAIKMRFRDDDGELLGMPEPKFINTRDIKPEDLIYSREIEAAIQTNLFTPIQRLPDCVANGIPIKRGVMLGGLYGTGKTLAAKLASRYAVDGGLTYVVVLRADELDEAIKFAKLYSKPGAVLFCEDIDRAMKGERTVKIDDILNTIDGIDSKSMNLITVLTTNFLDNVNPAMLRPGRLDAIIEIKAPDAEACERLVRHYGGKAINPATDLTKTGKLLEGNIPAVIAEVVKRAKLSQLTLSPPGTIVTELSEQALEDAAYTMTSQNELMERANRPRNARPALDEALGAVIAAYTPGGEEFSGKQQVHLKGALANGLGLEAKGDIKPAVQ